jgi:predicted outer membrane repeat protein/parallel beta-helix repeat protein
MKLYASSNIRLMLIGCIVSMVLCRGQSANAADVKQAPIADAGLSRYAAKDRVQLDGTGSYDPDSSGLLSYTWQQISGPSAVIRDEDTATPTIGGLVQTDEIQECEFELVVSDGELKSLPDTVKVIIVPDFGENFVRHMNPPFNSNLPTFIHFGGGGCVGPPWRHEPDENLIGLINIIYFHDGYIPDEEVGSTPTYYGCGDMIIVYLSSVAPDYKMPIQVSGASSGGVPAVDVGIRLNLTYRDPRYAVNRVTLEDAGFSCRSYEDYIESIAAFVASSVDGEQCWLDNYVSERARFYPNVLNVGFDTVDHALAIWWYDNSWTSAELNKFNNGIVGGAYWSVIGPGKNLQLTSLLDTQAYKFKWYGSTASGYMDFHDESNHPGRLPEPVMLVGPEDGAYVDAIGAVLSCKESENAVRYQLLFGPDPHRVMDYYIVSDTLNPPSEVIISSPFEQTWWTVKAYDQYGSTIYADPIQVNFEKLDPPLIENITTGQRYASVRHAVNEAHNGHEIIVSPGVYKGSINFRGKNLTVRSINPNDSVVVAATVITGDGNNNLVTFSGGEDANCVLEGFTITGGKRGIYCSGSSPTITNCTIVGNGNADIGAGIYIKDGSNPTVVNCMFIDNVASLMGGGIQNVNSSPTLINCTFSGNSAAYFGGGIYCAGGSLILTNCILWDNTPEEISIFGGTPVITHSNIQGGFSGEGNIDTDPLFADISNGDYHLKSQAGRWDSTSQSWVIDDVSSPCIDAGDPSIPIDFEPLPNGDIINMGAYGGTLEASKSP